MAFTICSYREMNLFKTIRHELIHNMYTKHVVNIYIYTTYLHVFKPMCKRLKRRYEYGNSKSINGKIGYRTAFIDLNKINDDV